MSQGREPISRSDRSTAAVTFWMIWRDDIDQLSGELRCDSNLKNLLRTSSCDIQYFLTVIGHTILKLDTNFRKAIFLSEKNLA